MKITELVPLLEGEIVCCEDRLDREVQDVVASDLLSDVLAAEKNNYALVTGLTNGQVVRTAEITNACCVIMVRNKQPQQAAVTLAQRCGMPLILSPLNMFEACSRLGAVIGKPHGGPARTPDQTGT